MIVLASTPQEQTPPVSPADAGVLEERLHDVPHRGTESQDAPPAEATGPVGPVGPTGAYQARVVVEAAPMPAAQPAAQPSPRVPPPVSSAPQGPWGLNTSFQLDQEIEPLLERLRRAMDITE